MRSADGYGRAVPTDDDTALVVPIPEAEELVGDARARFDPAAAEGVPAHVTVVHPFLPLARVTPEVVDELAALVAARPAPATVFARTARFPQVLYLAPEPAAPFVELTRAVVARWPEAPPYGGRFGDDPTPHLTVTLGAGEAEQAAVERDVLPGLPFAARPAEAVLLGFEDGRWTVRHRFPFGS